MLCQVDIMCLVVSAKGVYVCVQRHTLALEAVERCITLFMALGNLHWFTPATCPPQLEVKPCILIGYDKCMPDNISMLLCLPRSPPMCSAYSLW